MWKKSLCSVSIALMVSQPLQAANSTIETLLQDVITHYPAIKTAYIQVAKAQQENLKIQGQLGWQLGAQGAFNKEVSLFGSPVDQTIVGGNLSRLLESGDRMSFSASVKYEDAEESFASLPNPATSSELKFEYIKPLGKGAGNIEYNNALQNARASVDIESAARQQLLDDMATQVIELYLAAINTNLQIENTRASIKRTQKLSRFINDRLKLGIVEDKDQLQTDAQLESQRAQLSALQLAWTQQKIAINRLTGKTWNNPLTMSAPGFTYNKAMTPESEIISVVQNSSQIKQLDSLIAIAENQIKIQRQNKKDQLDLKLYIGNKTSDGDSTAGDVSNSDVVAGVQLDFKQSVDQTADNAALYQAQLERGLHLQNKKLLLDNLHFDLASLLAELKAVNNSIKAYQRSKRAEVKKLKDAEQRYKSGRIDIDQLLQFENQLSATDLSLNLQTMELQQRLMKLALIKGELWKNIKLPVYDFENDDTIIGEDL